MSINSKMSEKLNNEKEQTYVLCNSVDESHSHNE